MKKVLVSFLLLFLLVSTSYGNTGIGLGLDLGLGSGSSFMPMVQYLFIDDLDDTKGIQADFTASRDTMMSYIDPDTGYLTMAHADRTQLIDTTTGQNPTSADSWWVKENATVDGDGGIVATSENSEVHGISKSGLDDAVGSTYIFSAKIKVGSVNYAYLRYWNATTQGYVNFNLVNGTMGGHFVGDYASYGMSAVDDDGYRRCWISFTLTNNVTTYYIRSGSLSDSYTYEAADTVTPQIYVKEIMLEEVPSDLALGTELQNNPTFTGTGGTEAGTGTIVGDVPDNWTVFSSAGGTATVSAGSLSTVDAAAVYHNRNEMALVTGSYYQVSIVVSAISGTIEAQIKTSANGAAGDSSHPMTATTTYTWIFQSTVTGNCGFHIELADGESITMDSVTVREIPAATMYNALGPEEVVDGGWAVVGTETATNYLAVDGDNYRLVSDGNLIGVSDVGSEMANTTEYLVQVTVTAAATGAIKIMGKNPAGGTYGNILKDDINAVGTYTIAATTSSPTYSEIAIIRSAGATDITFSISAVSIKKIGQFISPSDYINASSIPAEPRFEADGLAFMGASVLNLMPYSEDFSLGAGWVKTADVTATFGQADPMGGYTASLVGGVDQDDPGSDNIAWRFTDGDTTIQQGEVYTFSIWMRGSGTVPLTAFEAGDNYTIYKSESKTLTTAWQRFHMTFTKDADVNGTTVNISNMLNDTVYIWGANVTEGAFLAPYIPSHGAPTYTGPETVTATLSAALKNILSTAEGAATSKGTVLLDWTPDYDESSLPADNASYGIVNPVDTNQLGLPYCYIGSGALLFYASDNTKATAAPAPTFSAGDTYKLSVMWDSSTSLKSIGWSKSGGAWSFTEDDTFDGTWSLGTNLNIGYGNPYPFHIKDLRFYKRALTTDQIEEKF